MRRRSGTFSQCVRRMSQGWAHRPCHCFSLLVISIGVSLSVPGMEDGGAFKCGLLQPVSSLPSPLLHGASDREGVWMRASWKASSRMLSHFHVWCKGGETMAVSFKDVHCLQEMMLTGVRCSVAFPVSTRHRGELMLDRGVHIHTLPRHLSLSRLNHWLPRGQAHPEIMQGTTDFHHDIADARLPQADPVFDDVTALHTAVDMLDPQPPLVQRLVGS